MGDWKPLIYFFLIIFAVGLIMNFLVKPFIDPSLLPSSTLDNTLSDTVDNGIGFDFPIIGTIGFNPFSLFGSGVKDFMSEQVALYGLIPSYILIPYTILMIVLLIVGLIKAFVPTE